METLVLDVRWRPERVVPWTRAITQLMKGKVEVVATYDKNFRSDAHDLQIPSIVRNTTSFVRKDKHARFSRENVYARDKGRCQYCGQEVTRHAFQYEHVTPRTLGGKTTWENVVVACNACNQKKGGRTPEQAGMRLLRVPRMPKPEELPHTLRLTLRSRRMPDDWLAYIPAVVVERMSSTE